MSAATLNPGTLAAAFARTIAHHGPISIAQYMAEANAQYYGAKDPFGTAGDFITAPEISQMFGELIGVWLADLWARAGKPPRVLYVEAGPGRGTLACDALGVMARFGLRPEVHLIEASPALRGKQAALLPGAVWHDSLATLPQDVPLLFVANEFFDALPIRQLVMGPAGWRERMVAIGADGGFIPLAGDRPMDAAVPLGRRNAPPGTIIETCPAAAAIMDELSRRLAVQGGGALVIDYGYDAPRNGSSLQAVRGHARADPFDDPGNVDLTALVDFSALVGTAHAMRCFGPVGQGAWLEAMGIAARADALIRAAPARADDIRAARHRLTAADQMGDFRVMALASAAWPDPAGFAP